MKSYYRGPIGTHQFFRTLSFPTPYSLPFPMIGQPDP